MDILMFCLPSIHLFQGCQSKFEGVVPVPVNASPPSEHRAPRLFSAELPLVCGVADRGRARLDADVEHAAEGDTATSVRGREPNSDTGGETSLFLAEHESPAVQALYQLQLMIHGIIIP